MVRRNSRFREEREPFSDVDALQLQHEHITGPFSFLNPTNARFKHTGAPTKRVVEEPDTSSAEDEKQNDANSNPSTTPASDVSFLWRSRDNRKGRHALLIKEAKIPEEAKYLTPALTTSIRQIGRTLLKMLIYFPVWDISWLIAYIFTWGSIVWVINGWFSWLPFVAPSTTFSGETLYAGGITAFIGAVLLFESGSILLLFEAVNENHSGCFGYAVEELFDREGDEEKQGKSRPQFVIKPKKTHCSHHHVNKGNFVGKSSHKTDSEAKPKNEYMKDGDSWQWFPGWKALRDHYFHEVGFLASFSQFLGASIFSIAGFTALPGIQNHLSQRVLNGVYWIPQIVGAAGFVISGSLYMLETQKNWYTPSFHVLGWWVGFWNLIGAIGFELCGCLGPAYGNSGAEYQASLSTWWGSWAFLIGSLLQLYESLDKNPVEKMPGDGKVPDDGGKQSE